LSVVRGICLDIGKERKGKERKGKERKGTVGHWNIPCILKTVDVCHDTIYLGNVVLGANGV
jgi:hypothetical protein